MKSFQEIFNQTLAEARAGRLSKPGASKGSPFEQSPYILEGSFKAFSGKKPKKPSNEKTEEAKVSPAGRKRILTEPQKQALEFFRSYGEMLDDHAGTIEIKKAFRRLAKKLHPDRAFTVDPAMLKKRAFEFQQLHLAYRKLIS